MRANREEEIVAVMNLINDICNENEISLLPYTTADGTQLVIVRDEQNGEQYALYIGE